MNINCFCLVQDMVLNYVVKKYISNTPFLSFTEGDISNSNFSINEIEDLDLIIAEINLETKDKLNTIFSQFENKYFLILTDFEQFLNPITNNKAIILKKDITYSDFINGLSVLVS